MGIITLPVLPYGLEGQITLLYIGRKTHLDNPLMTLISVIRILFAYSLILFPF